MFELLIIDWTMNTSEEPTNMYSKILLWLLFNTSATQAQTLLLPNTPRKNLSSFGHSMPAQNSEYPSQTYLSFGGRKNLMLKTVDSGLTTTYLEFLHISHEFMTQIQDIENSIVFLNTLKYPALQIERLS